LRASRNRLRCSVASVRWTVYDLELVGSVNSEENEIRLVCVGGKT
jgi:hypothetical protein